MINKCSFTAKLAVATYVAKPKNIKKVRSNLSSVDVSSVGIICECANLLLNKKLRKKNTCPKRKILAINPRGKKITDNQ